MDIVVIIFYGTILIRLRFSFGGMMNRYVVDIQLVIGMLVLIAGRQLCIILYTMNAIDQSYINYESRSDGYIDIIKTILHYRIQIY